LFGCTRANTGATILYLTTGENDAQTKHVNCSSSLTVTTVTFPNFWESCA
jgi:hypothetical protein